MNFGESIKKIRKEKGLTQKQLGEKLGISQAAIGQFESNKANPQMETIRKIADALEVELWEIVELDQMDLETRIQQIKKMVAQLTPEALEKFEELFIEDLNRNQESVKKEQDEAAKKAHAEVDAQEKVHELFDSIFEDAVGGKRESTAVQVHEILTSYNQLNDVGREEAIKRVNELTEIPKYTKPDDPPQS